MPTPYVRLLILLHTILVIEEFIDKYNTVQYLPAVANTKEGKVALRKNSRACYVLNLYVRNQIAAGSRLVYFSDAKYHSTVLYWYFCKN